MKKSILIVGHGYLGGHLSELLESDTFEITATTRNRSNIGLDPSTKLNFVYFDVLDPEANELKQPFDAVVYCVGFDSKQGASRKEVYVDGLRHFLSKLRQPPEKFVYISSTGVYGNDNSGDWTNEETPTNPTREGGLACLEAEKLLTSSLPNVAVTVLRLAGIYGPDRIPNRKKIETGEISFNTDGFLNLIHVRDAAQIIKWFIEREKSVPGIKTFNVSDGKPARRIEFYSTLAKLMGIELPSIKEAEQTTLGRKGGNKRISNAMLVSETGYQFEFESYEQGLQNILHP